MKRILPTRPGQSPRHAWHVPDYLAESVRDIDFPYLRKQGIRCVALDIDSTLLPHGGMELDPSTIAFLQAARDGGSIEKLCIATNRFGGKVQSIAAALKADVVVYARGTIRKPRLAFYKGLAASLGCEPQEIVMVGDKLVQDIYGAKRAGLHAILVEPLGPPAWFDHLLLLRWRQMRVRRHWKTAAYEQKAEAA